MFGIALLILFIVVALTAGGITIVNHSARLDEIEEDIIQLKIRNAPEPEEW